jgi:hypothetical protein
METVFVMTLFLQLICSLHKVRKASILSKVAQVRKSLHSIATMAQDPTVDRIDDLVGGGHTVVDRVDDLFGGGNAEGDGIVAELRGMPPAIHLYPSSC